MYKRLVAYALRVDGMLQRDDAADWDAALAEHVTQIRFFQHERLVHLLVTLAFALMTLAAAALCVVAPRWETLALLVLLAALLVPYVVHYYHLENGTQRLYEQYDRLARRAHG